VHREAFTDGRLAFIVGVPLAWAILLLFRPTGDEVHPTVRNDVTAWLVVHRDGPVHPVDGAEPAGRDWVPRDASPVG
jgi:hypothetical protein